MNRSGRQLAMYDPKSKQFTLIDTCFSTHHLQFAEDANDTLWTSSGGGGDVVGWLNTKMFEQTHDEQKSQGWTAAHPRHQRQRQARRVCRAQRARRSRQGQARLGLVLRRHGQPRRRLGLGYGTRLPRPRDSHQSRSEPHRNRARRSLRTPRAARPTRRAASISTATASSGPCSPADISPASTAASARS